MKKIFFIAIFIFFLIGSIKSQITVNFNIGTGLSYMYKIKFVNTIDDNVSFMPSMTEELGFNINYKFNSNKYLSTGIDFKQKKLKTKFFVQDSILVITDDTSYYEHNDLLYHRNIWEISIPISVNKVITDKFSIGFGITNDFLLCRDALRDTQMNFKLYRLGGDLNFNYMLFKKAGLYIKLHNDLLPTALYIKYFDSYFLYNFSFYFGFYKNITQVSQKVIR